MIRRAVALLLLCAAPAARAAGPGPSTTIVGGTTDPGDPAVVLVAVCDAWGSCGTCTGVLVAPRVVATAAHCVRPDAGGSGARPSDVRVFTGTTPDANGPAAAITAWETAAGWDDATLANDLALLRLETALGPAPLPIQRSGLDAAAVGADVRLVGYGQTGPDAYDSGVKREALTSIDAIDAGTIEVGADGYLGCAGDSGAPMLVTAAGKEAVAAIQAWGDGACAAFTVGERLDVHLAWIDAFVAASGGYTGKPAQGDGGGCATGDAGTVAGLLAVLGAAVASRRSRRAPSAAAP